MIDIEMYKIKLEKELTLVEGQLKEVAIKDPDDGEWKGIETESDPGHADDNDVATDLENFDENQGITTDLQERYKNIKASLKKIEDGTYGVCEVCGGAIPEDRLGANPSARTCVEHTK